MTFFIHDKADRVLHSVRAEGPDAALRIKQHLVGRTSFDDCTARQLYVHVPYCFFHCSFCVYKGDLLKSKGQTREFLTQLEREMAVLGPLVSEVEFQSVFVGGGTVTVLEAEQLRSVLCGVRERFRLEDWGHEFTVELAPHGLSEAKLDVLEEFGVNRVTMGLQSLDTSLLRRMGRPPINSAKLQGLVDSIHRRSFAEANFDLMVGIDGRDLANLDSDFRQLAEWGCESIMVYIDMQVYRDSSRVEETARVKSIVERLSESVSSLYTLNHGEGVNEYNRFLRRGVKGPSFSSRYSTDYHDRHTFCLGLGRQAKSWNRQFMFYSL